MCRILSCKLCIVNENVKVLYDSINKSVKYLLIRQPVDFMLGCFSIYSFHIDIETY